MESARPEALTGVVGCGPACPQKRVFPAEGFLIQALDVEDVTSVVFLQTELCEHPVQMLERGNLEQGSFM